MSLLVKPEMVNLIQERGNIWAEFDQAVKNREALKSSGNRVKEVEFVDPINDSLSESGTSPAELSAALYKLQHELKEIDNIELEIKQCERGIRDEEARIKRNKIIAIIVVIVVIVAVLIVASATLIAIFAASNGLNLI